MENKLRHLKILVIAWTQSLKSNDLQDNIPMKDMTELLDQLLLAFFARHLMSDQTSTIITFGWLPEEDQIYLGIPRSMPYGCRIELHPTETCTLAAEAFPKRFNVPMQSRIATLIHELCHSLLHVNICR
jgi:hypothetical protein